VTRARLVLRICATMVPHPTESDSRRTLSGFQLFVYCSGGVCHEPDQSDCWFSRTTGRWVWCRGVCPAGRCNWRRRGPNRDTWRRSILVCRRFCKNQLSASRPSPSQHCSKRAERTPWAGQRFSPAFSVFADLFAFCVTACASSRIGGPVSILLAEGRPYVQNRSRRETAIER
jgi:hypothetical protein